MSSLSEVLNTSFGENSDPDESEGDTGARVGGSEIGVTPAHPSFTRFQALLKEWEEGRAGGVNAFDATPILEEMAEILEKEHNVYLSRDPDPFEERHPSRVDPEGQFGQLLKAFFRKESLVQDVFNNYLRDNYFSFRIGVDKSSMGLNVAALRLALDIVPGLEQSALVETDGLVRRLYTWAEQSEEPLSTYSTGLLSVAMELTEVASNPENRERNNKIVPVMISRLRRLQQEAQEEREQQRTALKRPFKAFANSAACSIAAKRRYSREVQAESEGASVAPASPSIHSNSNSSWAEMESQIIGHFSIHPVSRQTRQVFALRLLTPLAEYQEFLSFVLSEDIIGLLRSLLDTRENKDSRLAFETLKLLAALASHKKFLLDWVAKGGIQLLLEIPRPSIAATAVMQVFYFLSCDNDVMEKVCMLPREILHKLVKFVMWCLECSHESGRRFAVMFFGTAAAYPILLDILDEEDGLRRLYNTISMLRILTSGEDTINLLLTEDEEFLQRQSIRHAVVAFKRYFEAHLASKRIKMSNGGVLPFPYKPLRFSTQQVIEQVETLMEVLPFRSRWPPVDKFLALGGVTTCLQVVAMAFDWTFAGRAEMVRAALEVLLVCSVMPRVQLHFCERIALIDQSKTVGINIILGAAEGEIVQDSAEVRRSALHVILNLVCAPICRPELRPGADGFTTPSSSTKKKGSSEDLINKVWDCVRSNNGIMALLELLLIKTPITDADYIRSLACKALVGLARSEPAKQIMSKLPIFTNGQLQQLAREPILQDKRVEHEKFQQYALQLMKMVLVREGSLRNPAAGSDFSMEKFHRANVVAQTKISFPKKQLLQLIQDYLLKCGLVETAAILQKEANLALMKTPSKKLMVHWKPGMTPTMSPTPTSPGISARSNSNCPGPPKLQVKFLKRQQESPSSLPLSNASTSNNATATTTATVAATTTIATTTSLMMAATTTTTIATTTTTTSTATTSSALPPLPSGLDSPRSITKSSELLQPETSEDSVNLVSIVCDYLSTQHSLCQNPMTTCPQFDLLVPHKCPDPRPKNSAPLNFTARFVRSSFMCPPYGVPDGLKLNRKLVYSKFRSVRAFRAEACHSGEQQNTYTSCAFMPDDSFLLAGTTLGELKMLNLYSGQEESTYNCHESTIYHIQPKRDASLVLTSCSWRTPYSCLWSLGEWFEQKLSFRDEEYVEFSKQTQDKVIGTRNEIGTIFDIATGQKVLELKPVVSNGYSRNRATFDFTDDLVLNDGVIFDTRMGKEIRKLDKLNQHLSGVFHPSGLEIVSNCEVWDLRTFRLIKTVRGLEQCQVTFSNSGDIIYAVSLEQDDEDGDRYESSFKVFDASDYSSIATIETRRGVYGLSSSRFDLQLAVVENSLSPLLHAESVVRVYDVGRSKADQEEEPEDRGDDEDDEDGAESDEDPQLDLDELLGSSSSSSYSSTSNDEEDDNEEGGDAESNHGVDASNDSDDSWVDMESEVIIG